LRKTKAEMEIQSFTCSNPECGKVFADPIIVQDISSKNESSYHACPYCLTEIVIEKTPEIEEKRRTRNKKRIEIEEEKVRPVKIKSTQQPSLEQHECLYHFGYLSQRSRKEEIPEECMTCEKVVQCMLKKVTG